MKNKVLAILLAVLIPLSAFADSKTVMKTKLVGLGMSSELSNYIANTLTNGDVSYDNADYIKWRNAAGTADISVLRVTSGDETVLNADSGDALHFAIAGTNKIDFDGTDFLPTTTDSVNLGSSAATFNNIWSTGDLAISGAGNSGLIGAQAVDADVTAKTTADPKFFVSGAASVQSQAAIVQSGVADSSAAEFFAFKTRSTTGDDANTIISNGDGMLNITAFGSNGTSYDPAARIRMLSAAAPGAATDMPGKIIFETTPDSSATLAAVLTLDQDKSALFTGTVRSSATADIGWVQYTGLTNATCNTQCTSACVIGLDTDGAKTTFVACNAATAENCLCAGAS